MKKQTLLWPAAFLAALLLISFAAYAASTGLAGRLWLRIFPEKEISAAHINLLKITSVEDFNFGRLTGLRIVPEVGNGALSLKTGKTEGTFTSAIYQTDDFRRMVASWNASICDGGEVEIWARARYNGVWSEWMSWGPFTPYAARGSQDNKYCPGASIDQDIFQLEQSTADAVQLRAEVRRSSADIPSPVLRQISLTFDGGDMQRVYAERAVELPEKALMEAPAASQYIRHPSLADSICSPVALTIMLNSRLPLLDLLPEECALNLRDEGEDIFGNWAFTASGAGLYGFEAYVQYASRDILLQELAQGRATVLSVCYQPEEGGPYPQLDGALSGTGGHLITAIGYEYEDGVRDDDHLYIYSSDSYAESDVTAYRRYRWTQLAECWAQGSGGIAYIIPSAEPEENAEIAGITRINASLERSARAGDAFLLRDETGKAVDMRRFIHGGGLLAYTVEGIRADMLHGLKQTESSILYEHPVQLTANDLFYYDIACDESGLIHIDTGAALARCGIPAGERRNITVYAISDRGYLYTAVVEATSAPSLL